MTIEEKFLQLLDASADIAKIVSREAVSGNKSIYIGGHSPVGVTFPQIVFTFEEGTSEEILPAKRGTLYVRYHLDKVTSEAYKKGLNFCNLIDRLINKRPMVFEDVSYGDNRGLHVNRCVLTNKEVSSYNQEIEKYCSYMTFDIVMADRFMNYNSDNGEEITWP